MNLTKYVMFVLKHYKAELYLFYRVKATLVLEYSFLELSSLHKKLPKNIIQSF